ncbi:MAG: shikimate dehydrogenase [Campylobacterota bacterium]|nr:shikimate dehydrogenase [Campylobacterota bacterium]
MSNKVKHFTIFGNPVEHSKSPQMHNAGFSNIHYAGNYTKHYLEDGKQIKNIFIQNHYQGANITVPHKIDAFNNADEVRGLAREIGAVNTYILENNKVIAYNTDAPGFMKAIEEFKPIKSALILGSGGTSKAIAVAFKNAGIDTTVLNRSTNNLDFFQTLNAQTYTWENFEPSPYDLVVNCTSAGLKDDTTPAPLELLHAIFQNSRYAVDCIYGKITPFLQEAKKYNLPFKDGEDMLLYQGVIAFELFTNTKADNKVIKAMRQGLKGS